MSFIKKLLCGLITAGFLCSVPSTHALKDVHFQKLNEMQRDIMPPGNNRIIFEILPDAYKYLQELFFSSVGDVQRNDNLEDLNVIYSTLGIIFSQMNGKINVREIYDNVFFMLIVSIYRTIDIILYNKKDSGIKLQEFFEEIKMYYERIDSDSCKLEELRNKQLYAYYCDMKNYMHERYRYYFGIRPIIPSGGDRRTAITCAVASSIAIGHTNAFRIVSSYAGVADATATKPVVGTHTTVVETSGTDDSDKSHEVSGNLKRSKETHEDSVEPDSKKARLAEPDHVKVKVSESKESEQSNSESLKNSSSAEACESEPLQRPEDLVFSEENFNCFDDGELGIPPYFPDFSDAFRFN